VETRLKVSHGQPEKGKYKGGPSHLGSIVIAARGYNGTLCASLLALRYFYSSFFILAPTIGFSSRKGTEWVHDHCRVQNLKAFEFLRLFGNPSSCNIAGLQTRKTAEECLLGRATVEASPPSLYIPAHSVPQVKMDPTRTQAKATPTRAVTAMRDERARQVHLRRSDPKTHPTSHPSPTSRPGVENWAGLSIENSTPTALHVPVRTARREAHPAGHQIKNTTDLHPKARQTEKVNSPGGGHGEFHIKIFLAHPNHQATTGAFSHFRKKKRPSEQQKRWRKLMILPAYTSNADNDYA
jgi:hypothetical protein